MMKEKTLINKINKLMPAAGAIPLSEFYDDPEVVGIWFRQEGNEHSDGLPIYDCYCEFGIHRRTNGVHGKLDKILEAAGWFASPYDAGTLMAYQS